MDNQWAAEHLQTIRTLMERSALYRRALAPIMTFVGLVGLLAAVVGEMFKLNGEGTFAFFWLSVAVVAVSGALWLVRRQAMRQGEVFWSPPTRRVAQAMAPALLAGLVLSCAIPSAFRLALAWTLLYGLALHAAGFFMPRGIRLFAWALIMASILLALREPRALFVRLPPSCLMGILFGASHLAYGVYLYFTERKNAA